MSLYPTWIRIAPSSLSTSLFEMALSRLLGDFPKAVLVFQILSNHELTPNFRVSFLLKVCVCIYTVRNQLR